jgi:peptidoglycan hydrolase-like protein with peptidoglycan-binding domain
LYSTEELKKAGLDVSESKNVPTLRRGDKGPAVIVLQNLLNQWGANLNADGVFGAKTEAAVKDFQSTHKLTADGIVGSKTRAILDPLGLIGEAGGAQSEETVSSDDSEKTPVSDGAVHMTARDFSEICTAISSIASILKKYE